MSEAENENRRRIDALRSDFEKSEIKREANEEIQEKNMQILESNLKELLAKNEAAFERLRTTIEQQGKQQMWFIVAVVTLGMVALGFYLQYFQQ